MELPMEKIEIAEKKTPKAFSPLKGEISGT